MSIAACAAIVRVGDPDRFLATMAAPVALRARLFPIFALNVEVARAPWVTAEPAIAEMRLQWWRDAVQEVSDDRPARAHEVAAPLAAVILEAGLPTDMLDGLIGARRWEVWRDPFADAVALQAHLDRTAGHLMWLGCLCAGADPGLEAAARAVARAQGLANWLAAVPALEARGLRPLPDARPEAVRALAADALDRLDAARGTAFGPAVPVIRAAWRARALLTQAVRDPGAVADGRLGTSEFRRRGSLLLRAMLGRP